MTALHIHNEASRRHDGLTAQLTAIGEEVLPLVETVTGLPLPDPVVIRLVSLRAWRRLSRRRERRLYHSEIRDLPAVTRDDIRAAVLTRRTERRARKQTWFLTGGQIIDVTPGQAELVIMPAALRESGWLTDQRSLHRILAHEATHLAQYRASDPQTWQHMRTLFPRARGIEHLAHRSLIEGHAYWADGQITQRLLGPEENTGITPPSRASLRYRAVAESPEYAAARSFLNNGQQCVTSVIDAIGTDRFNQVWADDTLIPTRAEITNPATWKERFHRPDPT
ncbi:zinc-dependent metalloprotease [Streptomyces sp. NPDC004539]|uniref:zinc-dependent metalloprotease n=1 Tax=Streptomyces sp. NPDC004539 TaxID=3154280 RepID=UPI0033B33188